MKIRNIAVLTTLWFAEVSLIGSPASLAEPDQHRIVRIAEITIDPGKVDQYKTALSQEIATSIKVEPGVLALYAVSIKGQPNHVRLFEIYANLAAHEEHLKSAHFLQYKKETAGMVKSLNLLETDAILLGTK